MVYTTKYDPMSLAQSMTMLAGIYIISRSFRGSREGREDQD